VYVDDTVSSGSLGKRGLSLNHTPVMSCAPCQDRVRTRMMRNFITAEGLHFEFNIPPFRRRWRNFLWFRTTRSFPEGYELIRTHSNKILFLSIGPSHLDGLDMRLLTETKMKPQVVTGAVT
jgi:hypothetical protein